MRNLEKCFREIMEKTGGNCSSNDEVIDYTNGNSVSLNEIEDEYQKYLELEEEIDDYVNENDLDDVFDKDKIINHFKDVEDYFKLDQACLKDFVDCMEIKINKQNSQIRKANMIFNKNGNGFSTTKITIPVPWAKKLGFSENDKEGFIILKDNQIIIQKEL